MGNTMQTLFFKLPEDGTDFGPAFRTPLTDIAAGALHADYGRCVPFNAKYLNCMEAYGNIRGRKECVIYFQDLTECIHPRKQEWRLNAMRQERLKQYVKGQVGMGPEVPHYAEPPPMDSYNLDDLSNEG